jgi:hypothetical protein
MVPYGHGAAVVLVLAALLNVLGSGLAPVLHRHLLGAVYQMFVT